MDSCFATPHAATSRDTAGRTLHACRSGSWPHSRHGLQTGTRVKRGSTLSIALVLSACAGLGSAAAPPEPIEVEIFRAVVERALLRYGSLAVDPTPVSIGEGPAYPDTADYYLEPAPDRQAKERVIEAIENAHVARAFPLRAHCTPLMIPAQYRDTRACSEPPSAVLAMDKPVLEDDTDGVWTVRILTIMYLDGGRTAELSEIGLHRSETGAVTSDSLRVLLVVH